jgi:hypothetical protein
MTRKDIWTLTIKFGTNYRPDEFHFTHPPSREDFQQVIAVTPYLSGLHLSVYDWPMVDDLHKASHVDLPNGGSLYVRRHTVWCNECQYVPYIPHEILDKVINRLRKASRHDAHCRLIESENRIQERAVVSGDSSVARIEYEIRLVLFEAGFLKTKPKVKS